MVSRRVMCSLILSFSTVTLFDCGLWSQELSHVTCRIILFH